MKHLFRILLCAASVLWFVPHNVRAAGSTGVFQTNSDVGAPLHAGTVKFDAANNSYLVTGGGANMWNTNDAFQFVWKKVSDDVSLAADISFIDQKGDAHRKACLMIRQTLEPDSAYADAAVHGNGLIALQYRDHAGDVTKEDQFVIPAHMRLKIEKHGDNFRLSADSGKIHTEGAITIPFHSPFYVGLAVCAHDNKTVRQAVFSNVELKEEKASAK